MRQIRIKFAWVAIACVIAGCASDRIAGPATDIDTEIKALSGDVRRFTDQTKLVQTASNQDIESYDQLRGSFQVATAMLQAQWAIAENNASTRTLAQLDSLTSTSTAAGTNTAAASAASGGASGATTKPADPIASLSQVDQILGALAKPSGAKADFESGAAFAVATGKILKAEQAKAASAPVAASAPKAASAPVAASAPKGASAPVAASAAT